MDTIVISDIHLRFNDSREKCILNFFDTIAINFKRIIILGDFFEFWYGFPEVVISEYFPILNKFYELKEKNIEIIYIEGNHDFNMGNFFTEFLNIKVFTEYFETEINSKKFLFMHGDTINIANDRFYFYLRKFLRSGFAKFLMNNLPPYSILKIANYFSNKSREYLFKEFNLRKIIDDFQLKNQYDFIIAGHFHNNFQYENVYILGDWRNEFNYMTIDSNGHIEYNTKKFNS